MGKRKSRQQQRQPRRRHAPASRHDQPAPGLVKRKVTLTSIVEVAGSSIAGNGFQRMYLSPNGYSTPDSSTNAVPQKAIWDSYANMFDFYQVESIHATVYPYKFETTTSTTGVNPLNARPIYSCIDPESTAPTTIDGFASYGNMKVSPAYATHSRSLRYHELGIQKQDHVILKTNGSSGSREQYTVPAQLAFFGQNPAFLSQPFCTFVFTIHYVFSGQRNPGVNALQQAMLQAAPLQQPMPQQVLQQPMPPPGQINPASTPYYPAGVYGRQPQSFE